jgi:hypothetical protein
MNYLYDVYGTGYIASAFSSVLPEADDQHFQNAIYADGVNLESGFDSKKLDLSKTAWDKTIIDQGNVIMNYEYTLGIGSIDGVCPPEELNNWMYSAIKEAEKRMYASALYDGSANVCLLLCDRINGGMNKDKDGMDVNVVVDAAIELAESRTSGLYILSHRLEAIKEYFKEAIHVGIDFHMCGFRDYYHYREMNYEFLDYNCLSKKYYATH